MKTIVGVRFRKPGKVYFFDPDNLDIEKGQKVAQLVMTQVLLPEFVPEEDMPAQDARGNGGFGSTGK